MKNRLNADGHDESQYLPKKWFNPKTGKDEPYPIVNPFREAKGDIIRNSDDKLECPTWLPRIMFVNGRLEKMHYDTAVSMERIWKQAKRTLGIDDTKGKLFDDLPTGETNVETDKFIAIRKALPRAEFIELIWFIAKHFPARSAALPLDMLGRILHALEVAQNVIDETKGKSDNAKSTLPEVCPESDPV